MAAENNADIVVEPIEEKVKDPIADLVKKWKDKVINTVLVLALIVFFANFYYQSKETNMKNASDNLSSLQTALAKIRETKDEQSIKVLNDNLKILNQEPYPYSSIAALYSVVQKSESASVADRLAALNSVDWQKAAAKDRLFVELQAFSLARSLLGSESDTNAKSALSALARDGEYASVAAITVLARLSETQADKDSLVKIIESVTKRSPEQTELLEGIRKRLVNK